MLLNIASASQQVRPLRIAIVEDNATARANLRSHLMAIDNYDIASYSNGRELRNGLRLNNFDLVLMDFHLGQSKNGVEWILQLQENNLFKPNTGLVFITSDGMPQTIGQILDLHPDFILIKPYTIKSLRTNLAHYLNLRNEVMPVLSYMAQKNNYMALNLVTDKIDKGVTKRFKNDFLKLRGRLLLAEKQYADAVELYSGVLKKSSNVLWAHWGLIKSEFFTGKWVQCQRMLNHLISESLTKDKAYEWMASVAIGKEEYREAENLLNNIKESELSIQATRLKVLCYEKQNKHELAQKLLEKKIQNNLTVKDRMADFALDLARFHIQMAESVINNKNETENAVLFEERKESLSAARKLITKVGKPANDRQGELQRDYLLALAFLLEGETDKAKNLVSQATPIETLSNAKLSTLVDAVKIWFGIGDKEKASELLAECDDILLKHESHIDKIIVSEAISEIEEKNNIQKDRALHVNEKGLRLYQDQEYFDALACFHKAYAMFPGVPAFSLNLLQCMADMGQHEYKGLEAEALFKELNSLSLSEKNEIRLGHVKVKLGI
jgi:CheY-like chemotaxis protein